MLLHHLGACVRRRSPAHPSDRSLGGEGAEPRRVPEGFLVEHDSDPHDETEYNEYNEYTHVYPRPGCDVSVLPSAWVGLAQEILAKFKPQHVEGGQKYQGCCCGYEHTLLAPAEIAKLRDAGFLVENDTEAP